MKKTNKKNTHTNNPSNQNLQNTAQKPNTTAQTQQNLSSNTVKENQNKLPKQKTATSAMREKKRQAQSVRKKQKAQERAAYLEQKEKERAQARATAARVKMQNKELIEKEKQAKAQAKTRKIQAKKQATTQAQAAQKKRKSTLKSLNKQDKKAFLANERAEKMRVVKQNAANKKRLRQEKKQAALLERQARRANRKNSKNVGWIAAVVTLSLSVLVLGTMLILSFTRLEKQDAKLSATYEKSFYDLVGYVDNLDNNLAKLKVTNTPSKQQRILTDIAVQAELAELSMQQLPIKDENKFKTVSFINNVADYSKALIAKIATGQSLSQEEEQNIYKIYTSVSKLKAELGNLAQNAIKNGYSFASLEQAKPDDLVLASLNELEHSSVDYPKLIYDGPFSAALENRQAKALIGLEEITKEQAIAKFKEFFSDYEIEQVMYIGEVNSAISAYNISADLKSNHKLYAQISKNGGKLVMFDSFSNCNTTNVNADICQSIAAKFLQKVGFANMQPVWINDSSNIADINFAYEDDGVIVYSDLVKVKVCQERGVVIGIEAASYHLNHTGSRNTEKTLSSSQARQKVTEKLDIITQRLTIIPTSGGNEVCAYEFMGTYDGSTYYIYIDAKTGNEAEVFRVVSTDQGKLLM